MAGGRREQDGDRKPQANVYTCHKQEDDEPEPLFCCRVNAGHEETHACEEAAEGEHSHEYDGRAGEELRVNDGVPVDRLRRETVQSALRDFIVDRVETEHDAEHGAEEAEEGREAVDIRPARREKLQEHEVAEACAFRLCLERGLLECADRAVEGGDGHEEQEDKHRPKALRR